MSAALRLLATPRWFGWTLLALAAVVFCGVMAYWQVIRAESPGGTLLNAGYAFQWPLFGLFFAALWFRMLVAEARILGTITDGPDAGSVPVASPAPAPGAGTPAVGTRSPFTPRPAGMEPGYGAGAPVRVRHRDDYNAMFAQLARPEEKP